MRRTLALITLVLGTWLFVPAWAEAQTPGWFSRVNIGSTTGDYCTILRGAGSPEGVVTGGVCDVYLRTDGAAGTVIYVKESGTGTTGWRAQPALSSPVTPAEGGTGQNTSAWSGLPTINAGTWTQNNVLTATRVLFGGASNTVASDAGFTFNGTTLGVTGNANLTTAAADTDGRTLTFLQTDTTQDNNQGYGRISFVGSDVTAGAAGERGYIYGVAGASGTGGAMDISFGTAANLAAATETMRLTSDGRLGLGNGIPGAGFHIETARQSTDNFFRIWVASDTATHGASLRLDRNRGTLAAPTPLQADDLIGRIQASGWDSVRRVAAAIQFHADAEWFTGGDTTDAPARISFWTIPDGSASLFERLRITNAGQILTGGATQVTSAGAGDLVLPNNTGELRAVNAAGTDTYPLIGSNASNQVSIASGGAVTVLGGALSIPGDVTQDAVLLISSTAPTVASGFGASPSVAGARTAAFTVDVGTGGVATGGVLTMPTATTGWNCHVENRTAVAANAADQRTVQTATTTTSVTVQNQTISTGAALAWTASDVLAFLCMAY
jgi:hypothetical protein